MLDIDISNVVFVTSNYYKISYLLWQVDSYKKSSEIFGSFTTSPFSSFSGSSFASDDKQHNLYKFFKTTFSPSCSLALPIIS